MGIIIKTGLGILVGVVLAVVLFTSLFVPSVCVDGVCEASPGLIPITSVLAGIIVAIVGGALLATPIRGFSLFFFGMAGGLFLWGYVLERIIPLTRLLGVGG